MNQKYVRVDDYVGGCDAIFTFPNIIGHNEFVARMGLDKDQIVSAGFVGVGMSDMGNPKFECYGKSVALGIESNKEADSKLLNYQHYGTYDQEAF